nr:MAG TPA: G protein pathway suppressor 2, SMRT, TBL1, co-repressor, TRANSCRIPTION [Caudoviricetes sp.]
MAQYVITDGTRWIMRDKHGRYVPTSCEALADVFSNKQATGIFQSNLSKALKSVFRVQKIDEPPKLIKQISQETVQENTEKVSTAENVQRWIDKIEGLNGLATEALHRKDELVQQLSKVDQELSDVNHYIEFCNLNAAQGYKAYKMIKDRRIKRRSIKNELQVVDIILSKKICETATDEIQKAIAGMDQRTYEPRVLNELFNF